MRINLALDQIKMAERPVKPGFYRVELFKTVWEVPERYQDLSPIGTGAYGTVWCVITLLIYHLTLFNTCTT